MWVQIIFLRLEMISLYPCEQKDHLLIIRSRVRTLMMNPSLSKRTKDSLSTFYQSKMEGITDNQELGFYVIQLGRIEQVSS